MVSAVSSAQQPSRIASTPEEQPLHLVDYLWHALTATEFDTPSSGAEVSEPGRRLGVLALGFLISCHLFQQLVLHPNQFKNFGVMAVALALLLGLAAIEAQSRRLHLLSAASQESFAIGIAYFWAFVGCLGRSQQSHSGGLESSVCDLAFCAPQLAIALLRLPARNTQPALVGHFIADSAVTMAAHSFTSDVTLNGGEGPTANAVAAAMLTQVFANCVLTCMCIFEAWSFEIALQRKASKAECVSDVGTEAAELAERLLVEMTDCVAYTEVCVTMNVVRGSPKLDEVFGEKVLGQPLLCRADGVQESWRLVAYVRDLVTASAKGVSTPIMLPSSSCAFGFQQSSGKRFRTELLAVWLPAQGNREPCIAVGFRLLRNQGQPLPCICPTSTTAEQKEPTEVEVAPQVCKVSVEEPRAAEVPAEIPASFSESPEESGVEGASPSPQPIALAPVVLEAPQKVKEPGAEGAKPSPQPVAPTHEVTEVLQNATAQEPPPVEHFGGQLLLGGEAPHPEEACVEDARPSPQPVDPTPVVLEAAEKTIAHQQPPPQEPPPTPESLARPGSDSEDKLRPGSDTEGKPRLGSDSGAEPVPNLSTDVETAEPGSRVDVRSVSPPPSPVTLSCPEAANQARPTPCLNSVGSIGHPLNCQLPCKFVHAIKGCKDGERCSRCHLCQWKKPKKSQTNNERAAKTEEVPSRDPRNTFVQFPGNREWETPYNDTNQLWAPPPVLPKSAQPAPGDWWPHTGVPPPNAYAGQAANLPGAYWSGPPAHDRLHEFDRGSSHPQTFDPRSIPPASIGRNLEHVHLGHDVQIVPPVRLRFLPQAVVANLESASRLDPTSKLDSAPSPAYISVRHGSDRGGSAPGSGVGSAVSSAPPGLEAEQPRGYNRLDQHAQGLHVSSKNTFLHCDSESFLDMMERLSIRPVSDPGVLRRSPEGGRASSDV